MMANITINIHKHSRGYNGSFNFHDLECKLYLYSTNLELLNSSKTTVDDWLKNELKHLKLDIKDIKFFFKFII